MFVTKFRFIIIITPHIWEVIFLLMRGFKSPCGFIS
nr:MAG TPA: hypothetical protein [Caudoviricetes sp.]